MKNETPPLWNDKTVGQKMLYAISIILAAIVIFLVVLVMTDVWSAAINVMVPLLGVLLILNAIQNWNYSRSVAWFNLIVAIFVVLIGLLKIFL